MIFKYNFTWPIFLMILFWWILYYKRKSASFDKTDQTDVYRHRIDYWWNDASKMIHPSFLCYAMQSSFRWKFIFLVWVYKSFIFRKTKMILNIIIKILFSYVQNINFLLMVSCKPLPLGICFLFNTFSLVIFFFSNFNKNLDQYGLLLLSHYN